MNSSGHDDDLDWLLSSFIDRIPGAKSAVVVSSDGLVLAMSELIDRDTADQLAAPDDLVAKLREVVEMSGGYLFVTTVSDGSALAVMCELDCDIGLIGYEMSLLVDRIGQVLTPALRAELQASPRP